MKKEIMKKAWHIAETMTITRGGTKKEWIGFGLHRAWKLFKEGKIVQETKTETKVQKLHGMMTSKQDWFITKLMKELDQMGIDVVDTIGGVREYLQNGQYGTSKQEASEIIQELLKAKKMAA